MFSGHIPVVFLSLSSLTGGGGGGDGDGVHGLSPLGGVRQREQISLDDSGKEGGKERERGVCCCTSAQKEREGGRGSISGVGGVGGVGEGGRETGEVLCR